MTLEVELKYRVGAAADLDFKLTELHAEEVSVDSQEDHYFNHPERDFAKTDEAFRVRVQSSQAFLTYKGPRIDHETKTRREVEVPLAGPERPVVLALDLFNSLGFRPVATVEKTRKTYAVPWQRRTVTLTQDEVRRLGLFVELELVVDEGELDQAKSCLLTLADHLGLKDPIHTSYLELLLQQTP